MYTLARLQELRDEHRRHNGDTGTARIVIAPRGKHTVAAPYQPQRVDADGVPYIRGRHRLQDAHPDTVTIADLLPTGGE